MNQKNKIIYEDVLSEEYLTEFAKIKTDGNFFEKFNILLAATPDLCHIGNPYFKVYNNAIYEKATKVARISFLKPELITGHKERNGKKEWLLEDIGNETRKEILKYLNSRSGRNKNVTVWTDLRYEWNNIKNICNDIEIYVSGEYDTRENLSNPNYIPYTLQMPNYLYLQNDKKGK